jgi:ribosome biogenesis GTPase / thiamine phosphate phosphatase
MKKPKKDKNIEQLQHRERIRKSHISKKHSELNKHVDFLLDLEKWASFLKKGRFAARIVEVHKKYVFIAPETSLLKIETKDVYIATILKKHLSADRLERSLVVVGDRVLCRKIHTSESIDLPQCVVEYRAPRISKIARLDPKTDFRKHVLAANITQIVIVASYLTPQIRWGLIDRILVLAELEKISVHIIINKSDLLEKSVNKNFKTECENIFCEYEKIGYNLSSFSVLHHSQNNLKKLEKIFFNQVSLIIGHSGVGKSSIVNLLGPEIIQAVEDRKILFKGRHTTSFASFLKINSGDYIIDTPGVRSFAFIKLSSIELADGFIEFKNFVRECKYRSCKHNLEQDCGVKKAVVNGFICQRRYESYLTLLLNSTNK